MNIKLVSCMIYDRSRGLSFGQLGIKYHCKYSTARSRVRRQLIRRGGWKIGKWNGEKS